MIYDCFSYWDEDLLLDLRLNILDNYVDYFVIVEGNKTWQNNPKKLRFEIDKFKKFKNKIIYVPVTDLPDGEDPYLRENHQRNAIVNGLNTIGLLIFNSSIIYSFCLPFSHNDSFGIKLAIFLSQYEI